MVDREEDREVDGGEEGGEGGESGSEEEDKETADCGRGLRGEGTGVWFGVALGALLKSFSAATVAVDDGRRRCIDSSMVDGEKVTVGGAGAEVGAADIGRGGGERGA